MMRIVVKSEKAWRTSPYADEKQYRGLPVREDEGLPEYTFRLEEVDHEQDE